MRERMRHEEWGHQGRFCGHCMHPLSPLFNSFWAGFWEIKKDYGNLSAFYSSSLCSLNLKNSLTKAKLVTEVFHTDKILLFSLSKWCLSCSISFRVLNGVPDLSRYFSRRQHLVPKNVCAHLVDWSPGKFNLFQSFLWNHRDEPVWLHVIFPLWLWFGTFQLLFAPSCAKSRGHWTDTSSYPGS